tara:strand:- start:2201 stop:3607 length:1407 start_codon:yes stop_codon:yes gene_type:complete
MAKKSKVTKKKTHSSKQYLKALRSFWEGRHQHAVEEISTYLTEVDDDKPWPYYRLWIEVLADKGDSSSLTALMEHIGVRMVENPQLQEYWMALKGIAHFFNEEYEMSKVALHSLNQTNHYSRELFQLCDDRVAESLKTSPLFKVKNSIKDYCVFQSLAMNLVLLGHKSKVKDVVSLCKKTFVGAPIMNAAQINLMIDDQNITGAKNKAAILANRFPTNSDFGFQYGYLAWKDESYEEAIQELNRVSKLTKENDPDTQCLIGICWGEIAISSDRADALDQSFEHLAAAITEFREKGLPVTWPSQELNRIRKHFDGVTDSPNPQAWMIKMSQKGNFNLMTSSESEISRIMVSIGEKAKPGDICFLVADGMSNLSDSEKEKNWRLSALYKVSSEPIWHPAKKFESELSLVMRPEFSVPLIYDDINEKMIPNQNEESQVFELDISALGMVASVLEDYAEDGTMVSEAIRNLV